MKAIAKIAFKTARIIALLDFLSAVHYMIYFIYQFIVDSILTGTLEPTNDQFPNVSDFMAQLVRYLIAQKFGFINGVDNVNWPPYRDSKS